ncbi:MAG TPA: competence/damage-inducible protein A [Acidimicrobiia bacterium]|nr:competence/damage-inducible protein A [Acidimicrobiia bacterium]
MIVEVVAVGTELLLGQIVNGNAATIGAALAEHGFDANYQQVVGDNLERMTDALRTALERSDAVIVTGGIGPTQDDLTREAICSATGAPMAHSAEYEGQLQRRWAVLGREMPPSNLRQADYPEGAELLPNPKGTAPGLAIRHGEALLFALPGVPEEMELLLSDHVMPRLHAAAGTATVIRSRILRTWGRPESWISDRLDDLYTTSTNPSVAFLASGGEIKVRLTAKAGDVATAEAMIAPLEHDVRRRLGGSIFGVDTDTIEAVIARELRRRGWTIGTAESVTAGMVAGRLTALPGSSEYFRGGIVPYAADLKQTLLGVGDLSEGVVSEPTALAMAAAARTRLGVDVAVALTGSAGPDPLEKPRGTVVIAVATPEKASARTIAFAGDRERVRTYAVTASLQLTRLAIVGTWWKPS